MKLEQKVFNKANKIGEGLHKGFSLHDNTDEADYQSFLMYHSEGICAIISKSYDEDNDEVVYSVSQPYDDFTIVSDREILKLLNN